MEMVNKSMLSSDRWLHGQALVDLAPMVVGEVQLSMDQDRHLWEHEASGKRLLFFQISLQPFFYGSITMVHGSESGNLGPRLNVKC